MIEHRRYYDPVSNSWIPKNRPDLERFARRQKQLQDAGEAYKNIYELRIGYEDVWYEGTVIRTNRHDRDELIADLSQEFPDIELSDYLYAGNTDSPHRGNVYEQKYVAVCMDSHVPLPSWHTFPPELEQYYPNYSYKLNRKTGEVWCKMGGGIVTDWRANILSDTFYPRNNLGLICSNRTGFNEKNFDLYFCGVAEDVRDWARENKIIYPCKVELRPWIYGAVFKDNKLEGLKGYVYHGYN